MVLTNCIKPKRTEDAGEKPKNVDPILDAKAIIILDLKESCQDFMV
jgi:hypothetical protein